MNRKLTTILSIILPLIVGVVIFAPHIANAEIPIIGGFAKSAINNLFAGIGYLLLSLTSTFVTITATFLSVSINITTHLKDIYETVTAIKSVWVTIRDVSSIFIIFSLLYFSIKTILGVSTGGINKIIVKIFIAGILINFSLFFFKIAIDASNIISLQFYRAIAPNTEQNWTVTQAFTDGGLSNVFMQSLRIPTIYQNTGVLKSVDVSLGIIFATYGGIILMVVTAISFLAAAIAFTARTAILLFCLAMSPVYFVGMIFPEIKSKVSDKIMGLLYSQTVFMPVYLFLLYIALKIISDPNFNAIFNKNVAGASDPTGFGPVWIGVIIQYCIAIFFINLPLVAALDLGAKGMKWAPQAGAIGKWMTGGYGKSLGKNTYGRAASKIAEIEAVKELASRTGSIGKFALTGVRNIASDYNKKLDEQVSDRTKFADSLGHDKQAVQALEAQKRQLDILKNSITANPGGTLTPGQLAALRTQYGATVNNVQDAKDIVERNIMNTKSARKEQYAHAINKRSIDTLYTKRARKDKVAAAKIQIPVLKDHLTELKDNLKDTKSDIKSLKNAITNNRAIPGGAAAGVATAAQATKLTQLQADEARHLAAIDNVQSQIDQLELVS